MNYSPGNCLSIQDSTDHYIIVYVAMNDEDSYQLAFLDYYEPIQPSIDFFENCSFFVTLFGSEERHFSAFETVTIDITVFDNDPAVTRIAHLNMPGQIGLNGLTPLDDINGIISYYEQYLRNYKSQEPEPFSPFTRSSITLNELAAYATPINPFATVKLYKEELQTLYFWQIYGSTDPACLIISQGKLGGMGEYQEVKDAPLVELKDIYQRLITETKDRGYREWDKHSRMILQFETNDAWGVEEDLDFRNEVWDYLNGYLFWTGNGAITGGDIGSGTVNLFFEVISPDMAVSTINAALVEKQASRSYIIALEENLPDDTDAFGIRVLYPENYNRDFHF